MNEPNSVATAATGGPTTGRNRRLQRILGERGEPCVLAPVDDSLLAGPINGLAGIEACLASIVEDAPNAVITFPGALKRFGGLLGRVPVLLNLTASTTRQSHTRKVQVCSVEHALQLGCDGVAVHVNLTSTYESEMLGILGRVSEDCERWGMPLLAIMYPRRERASGDDNYEDLKQSDPAAYGDLVAHAVRVGFEMGADLIKTQYPGSPTSFRFAVESCPGVKLFIAGGPADSARAVLERAAEARVAGAGGTSFGRNVFGRRHPGVMVRAIRDVLRGLSPVAALEKYPEVNALFSESSTGQR